MVMGLWHFTKGVHVLEYKTCSMHAEIGVTPYDRFVHPPTTISQNSKKMVDVLILLNIIMFSCYKSHFLFLEELRENECLVEQNS